MHKTHFRRRTVATAATVILASGGGLVAVAGSASATTWSCTTTSTSSNFTNGGCPSSGSYTDPNVSLAPNENDVVAQDIWNPNSGFVSQELDANSPHQWQAVTNLTPATGGAVTSSPEVQSTVQNWTGTQSLPVPFADYNTIHGSWNVAPPSNPGSNDAWEADYDMWLSQANQTEWSQNSEEIMVFADVHNQTPAGSDTGKTWTDPSTGAVYEIWLDTGCTSNNSCPPVATGTGLTSNDIVSFVAQTNAASGSIDLEALFKSLQTDKYIASSNVGVEQVTFGYELCDTSSQNETFAVNGYTLSATGDGLNGAPGGGSQAAPTATTNAATGVTSSGATLNGAINPQGADTHYQFDYGTTTSYGSNTTSTDGGSGTSSVNENATLTGLSPSTTYHYRIEATNSGGTTDGSDQTFTTSAGAQAPVVNTTAATGVTSSGATLNGNVNPEGQSTTYQFQYGTTTSYGSVSPTTAGSAGSGSSAVNESSAITGLTANTT